MTELTEEQLAELIAALRPAPAGWVRAAVELPAAREAIDQLVAQALADRAAREAILADLEQTVRRAGVEPRAEILDLIRVRLSQPEP
jgi:hypothetical protein